MNDRANGTQPCQMLHCTGEPARLNRAMHTITYAIGDIHGRLDLLDQLLDLVETDASRRQAHAKIVFTGDYMDRGIDSHGVVERLIKGAQRTGDQFVCLRGNHDDLFAKAVTAGEGLPFWAWQLHWHTIKSYGVERERGWKGDRTLARHAEFLTSLPLTHDDGKHLFVHAGIRPGIAIDDQLEEDLLWIRAEFLDYAERLPRRVVHGHTIMGDKPVTTINRVSIDTGAYRSGILTAAVLDDGHVTFLQAVGAPDRGAIVREAILHEMMAGRQVSPALQRIFDDYVAGRIDHPELQQRARIAA